MKVAVLSDIHANAHALSAVLAEIDRDPPDELWCLGDVVGYGPDPNACCAEIARRASVCLAGNHDLAVLGTLPIDEFNGDAAAAVRWTQSVLDESSRAFLAGLEPAAVRDGVELFHGSPVDPIWDYVLSEQAAEWSFRMTTAPLVLVGHSHVSLALVWDGEAVGGGLAGDDDEFDLSAGRWLLNPGSVGQPRGNDPRAAFLEIDGTARRARFRRVPYAIEQTQAEILERGLPPALAERLAHGV
jgi:diadenosine tetraphosphatase ApaH/serine/threonine PP2A family protein phosphatase